MHRRGSRPAQPPPRRMRHQALRVPESGKLPSMPAPTDPVSASPAIVALHSSVIDIGVVIDMTQLIVSPSTVPSGISTAPSAPLSDPVKLLPALRTARTAF